ncbi:hypothetical protein GCM10022253_04140 [Sphingomonas endophytica]
MPFQLVTPSLVLPATLPDSVATVCACAAQDNKAPPAASIIVANFILTSLPLLRRHADAARVPAAPHPQETDAA